MIQQVTNSYEETVAFAQQFATTTPKGSIIAFVGGLGMGKTAFTTGFVKGLGIDAQVSSPTFAICNDYIGESNRVYHFDMYRVDGWDDLYSTGYFDYVDTDAYIVAEWSENIFGALPDDAIVIEIERLDENVRRFSIQSKLEYLED